MSITGSNPTITTGTRRVPVWLYGALLASGAYIAWHLSAPGKGRGAQVISLGYLSGLSALSFSVMMRAALRPDIAGKIRRGLRYLAAGPGLMMVGSLYLLVENLVFGRAVNAFGIVDALFMAVYPLSAIGLLHFPRKEHLVAGGWRILVDGAAFVVGAGVPLWLIAVQPVLPSESGLNALMIILWPVAAFCGVVLVNASLLTSTPVPSRRAFWMLLGALGVSWVADLIFSLDAAAQIVVHSRINWINITNAVSLCLYLIAAWRFQTDPLPVRRAWRPAAVSPVPMITIVSVASWSAVLLTLGKPDPAMTQRLLVSLIFLLVILLVREMLVLRDSLRWVAAEARRESQARFEAMVRHSSDVIMVVDEARRIQFASPATATALGLPPDTLVGRELLEMAHADDKAKAAAFFDQLLFHPDADAMRILRWRLRNADGSHRHMETSGSNLLGEPTVGGFVLNSRDVTERTMLEDQLHQAQKMEAVGRLAGGVAHDFNNLLAVVLANSELGLLNLPDEHPARADLEEIRRASTRGAELTSRLLAFGRRENLQPQVISAARLLEDTAPALRRLLGDQVTLTTRVTGESGSIRVDPHDLEQALISLAANARDAMPKVGGELGISVRPEILNKPLSSDYLAAQAGRYVVVAVADNGAGMDGITRARLFEPFFSTKERSKGAGLGLASVFGMVKTSGGGIVVNSVQNRGTVIELWLPEVAPAVVQTTPAPVAAPTTGGGESILLVEDEAGVRRATQRILEAKGYVVLTAGDAAEARAMFAQPAAREVKLLLTDVIMPGQSGPVLAADLLRERPQLRVLFMSGYTGDELRTEGLARAGGQLLIKPFAADELTARVRKILAEPVAVS